VCYFLNKPKTYVYRLVHELNLSGNQLKFYQEVLKRGREFKGNYLRQTIKLVRKFKSFNARMKQCYYNAQRLTMFSNGMFQYYEGWATSRKLGIPFEHGWNVYKGRVVDLTWKDGNEYFGVHIPKKFIGEWWIDRGIAERLIAFYILKVGV